MGYRARERERERTGREEITLNIPASSKAQTRAMHSQPGRTKREDAGPAAGQFSTGTDSLSGPLETIFVFSINYCTKTHGIIRSD